MQAALAETADFYRTDTSARLDPKRRSELGQFMTATPIARFLASLFEQTDGDICLLDPGAGVGSLTASFVERICHQAVKPRSAQLICYEIEPLMIEHLQATLKEAAKQCEAAQISSETHLHEQDFILSQTGVRQASILDAQRGSEHSFSHVIMNPPYKKISSASPHRAALRQAGIETSNLYTGFMFLAAKNMKPGGEMIAIIPRSFCNGPYFKPFRQQFLSMMALRHIHVFESRNTAFKDDEVLQENIIIHAVKGASPDTVKITTSRSGDFEWDESAHECIAHDMTHRSVPYSAVVRSNDPEQFINIATNDIEQQIVERMAHFKETLAGLDLGVSTGPVVDFRLKDDLRSMPEAGTVPLLYAAHFRSGGVEWPMKMKKPNAINVSDESRRWLWPNKGHYVITKRFTSKEERRRVVGFLYSSELPGDLIGFENHLNVFHQNQRGIPEDIARGLFVFLNSSLVDRYFRQFNGHTQVNATDLRSLRYPEREMLVRMGQALGEQNFTQQKIDKIIEDELKHMTSGHDPLQAQQRIDEALEIL